MSLKLIKQKDFSLLIFGKLVSLLGSNIQQFALSLYVLSLTGSATIFASILSVSIVPRLILSPIAGVFGDWFDRKKSIVMLDLLNSIIIGIFAVIYIVNGKISIPLIYILVILLEVSEIFFHSAMSAVLPSIVNKDDYLEANSINSAFMNIGNIFSPIIAAVLYGIFGMKIILIVNSISFLLSSISEMFINIPKLNNHPEKINIRVFKTDFNEGINIIKNNKLLSTMIGLGTIINFSASPLFGIVVIYYLREVLLISDIQFGIFQMIFSVSMLAAPIFCGSIIRKTKIGKLIYQSFIIISILIFIMAIFSLSYVVNIFNTNMVSYVGLLIVSFVIGMVVTVANIALGTLFDKIVPLNIMGRTSTVFNFAVTVFVPLGQMIFGFLLDITFPSIVVTISGLILFITIIKYKYTLIDYDYIESNKEENLHSKM
ncbi:MAG: MFS transporter [Tissierellia bacterium]|nr:MFS transporter [Tissierellia bacterium]MDD4779605.1 MFS transporter [Tissierellia bacterium]